MKLHILDASYNNGITNGKIKNMQLRNLNSYFNIGITIKGIKHMKHMK
jgi:hypothetical protein